MAGILDSKSRVFDTLVTSEGRRQIASGELQIKFASFTDRQVVYASGTDGYLEDPGRTIYFEAHSDNNDSVIIETDTDGTLMPFKSDEYTAHNGYFFASGSTAQTGSIDLISKEIMANAVDSFSRQMIIGTNPMYPSAFNSSFSVVPNKETFYINDTTPVPSGSLKTQYIDDLPSIFQDGRFSNFRNYLFLPPITKRASNMPGDKLGDYSKINATMTRSAFKTSLPKYPQRRFYFDKNSSDSNLIGQIFEQHGNKLEKLALLELGVYSNNRVSNPESSPSAHYYYAGKLYRDSAGNLIFVNLFILEFA